MMLSSPRLFFGGLICGLFFNLSCFAEWTNQIGMAFVEIRNIKITSGIAGTAKLPVRKIRQSENPNRNYWLSTTETTQAQWLLLMGNNPSHHKGENLPVEMVSWQQAVEFCKKLSLKEGFTYRLPTESEWEHACHNGLEGAAITNFSKYAWTLENASTTQPVGRLQPNAWGLFDMQGNVAEWCADIKEWKDDDGEIRNDHYIVKGGAFSYFARDAKPEWSMAYPGGKNHNYHAGFIGFRVLRE